MTSPPSPVTIRCLSCRKTFEDWRRPSINLQMNDFDEEYIRSATIKTCPYRGPEVRLATLIVDKEGVWHFGEPGGNS
jgi:hypothetical protein